MALLNPVYAFVVPFLLLVTVPLALLAGITTTLAFALLILRVLVVYLDVILSLIPQSLVNFKLHRRYINHTSLTESPLSPLQAHSYSDMTTSATQQQLLLHRRRRRRPSSSISILSSAGSTTPISEMGLGLMPSVGPERDFEGIGGWRSGGDDDEAWTTINSRLELPDRQFGRNHYRTPSGGGATTPGDGGVLMMKTRRRSPESKSSVRTVTSPNSSRARTPSVSRIGLTTIGVTPDSYFPLAMSPKSTKKVSI